MNKKLLISVFVTLFFVSCAHTVRDAPLNYSYGGSAIPPSGDVPVISIDSFTDIRPVADPRMMTHLVSLDGTAASGGYQAEKPVGEIVRDGLTGAVAKFSANENLGSVSISGEVTELTYQSISNSGLTADPTVIVTLRVKLSAADGDGRVFWRDTLVGRGSHDGGSSEDYLRVGVSAAIDDLSDKLITDAFFNQRLMEAAEATQ